MEKFSDNQQPEPTKNTFSNFVRRKAAPLIVAGISALSAGGAFAKDAEQNIENGPTLEATVKKTESFSPENVRIVNSALSILDNAINDFKYTVEKEEHALNEKMDIAISNIQTCITDIQQVNDVSLMKVCSSNAGKIMDLLKEYRASRFSNEKALSEALHVRDITREYVDRYNAAYEESLYNKK